MDKSFWENKPIFVDKTKNFNQIVSNKDILNKVNDQINSSKLKLNYKLYSFEKQKNKCQSLNDEKLNNILLFINNNYIIGQDDFKYIYTFDLLKLFCKNSIVLEFYPTNNKQVIGYIIGKKTNLSCFGKCSDFLEANFLCLTYKLRNLGLTSFIINCLTRESIINYDIGIAHYTINSIIKSPYFCKKQFYHRMINIDKLIKTEFLNDSENIPLLKKIYNSFSYRINFNKHKRIVLINDDNKNFYKNEIYEKCKEYNKKKYDIYLNIQPEDIVDILNNKAFYNFVIVDSCDHIQGFVSFFKLDTKTHHGIYKNGFYYKMFFLDNLDNLDHLDHLDNTIDYLELVNEYIYKNNIFDVISFVDNFDISYKEMKCILGTGELKYYIFNYNFTKIDNHKNGLITI